MKKIIFVIAGANATGKTTFSEYLSKELNIVAITKDSIKETLVETIGYTNRHENRKLSITALELIKYYTQQMMSHKLPVIIESNFRIEEEIELENLIRQYEYQPITIYLKCNIDTLHKRFIQRNNSSERHFAHLSHDVEMKSFEYFSKTIESQLDFNIFGDRIELDTTDFEKVDYQKTLDEILKLIQN